MTVKELIKKLESMHPEASVHVATIETYDDGDGHIDEIPSDKELKEVVDHDSWVLLKPID